MKKLPLGVIRPVLSLALLLMMVSCASTSGAKSAAAIRRAKVEKMEAAIKYPKPQNFSLYSSKSPLDRKLLQRGNKARYSPSLDTE